jgi:small-conductance mechanosensitive channel
LLAALVIALAAVLAFPFMPGFSSPAFQGISVFLGLLLSLGSTSAISNVIGGVILIYTRAFRIGDHIRVGDVIGDIIEKKLSGGSHLHAGQPDHHHPQFFPVE